jgi:uncharacterized phiE125 gp8 family phage protein
VKYSVNVLTAPAAEPLTLAEAKKHCRIDTDITDQDTLISALIQSAREWAENHCRRSFVRRTLELRLDCFPGEIRLPRGPVSSVTSVKYTDQDGSEATVATADYQVDIYGTPPRIVPAFGVVWPTPKFGALNAVLVTYVAGYAPGATSPTDHAENVPQAVKAALKLIVGHLYEHRELAAAQAMTEVPFAVRALLAPYEVRDFTLE